MSSIPAVERTRRATSTHGCVPVRLSEEEELKVSSDSIPVGEVVEGAARGMQVVEVRAEATSALDVVAVHVAETAARLVVAHHPSASRRVRA